MTNPAFENFLMFSNTSYGIGMAAIGKDFYDAHLTGFQDAGFFDGCYRKIKRPFTAKSTAILGKAIKKVKGDEEIIS
jgi:hypothetical protein